ncbi:hypothetical protein TKK_0005173 [Trichogramma kaykai]|uniref:poly(ADP-ribose) glycohydrolase n=1 Tax=Trichogramma kaykai TaxID=54128 RepID=A0ABD2XJN8_9HYME
MASGSATSGGFLPCVILPCDLPWWWTEIVPQLEKARDAETTKELIDAMQRLIHTCNVSIDAIPPRRDPLALSTLRRWLDEHLEPAEFQHYFKRTIPRIAQWAIDLKIYKPTGGLCFSLQQFEGETEHSYKFIASLVANAFFSTYAMRTPTSHPSLRDFNFTGFFKHLLLPSQQAKLRCLFRYFDYLDQPGATEGKLLISRQVLKSENWLTIEDWAESKVPLCDLTVKYDGRMEDSEIEYCSSKKPQQQQQQQRKKKKSQAPVQVCFASKHVGCRVLQEGCNQECIQFITHPELLPILLMFESLEDNEALIVKGARFIGTIGDPKGSGRFVPIEDPQPVTMCCIDPDDFSTEPYLQYLDFNILRELNKSMLGFRQRRPPVEKTGNRPAPAVPNNNNNGSLEAATTHNISRLSPIGEQSSAQSTPSKKDVVNSKSDKDEKEIGKESAQDGKDRAAAAAERGNNIKNSDNGREKEKKEEEVQEEESSGNGFSLLKAKRRAFIVLHSSREKLPIRRKSWADAACSTSTVNSSASLSTESFHSAKENLSSATSSKSSFDTDSSCSDHRQAGAPNGHDTRVRRKSFAQRLQSAVEREEKAIRSNGDSVSLPAHPDDLQQQQQQQQQQQLPDGDARPVAAAAAAAAAARPLQMVAHRAYISEDRGEEDGRTLRRRLSTGFHLMDGPESDEMLRRSFEDLRGFGEEFQEEAKEVLTHAIETWRRKMSAPATMTTREVVPACNDIGCDQQVFDLTHRLLKRALSEPQADTTCTAAAERQQQKQEGQGEEEEEDDDEVQHRYKFLLTIKSLSLEMARRRSSVDSNFTSRSMENGNDHYCAYATNNNNHPKQHDLNELPIDDSIDDYYVNDNGDHRQSVKSCMKPYARQRSRNRLKAVAFTSEVYQTLFEDETTVALPVTAAAAAAAAPTPSVVVAAACNGGTSGAVNGHETHTGLKISRETSPGNDEDAAALLPVVTGNWGCGRRYRGEHQLKLFVQWMSASMAGVPRLVYYTRGREELANLEQIKRTLTERKCTVGDLVAEARRYAESVLREAQQSVRAGDPAEARLDEVRSSSRLISSLFEGTIENARHRF